MVQYYYMNIFFWWENGLHRRFHPQTVGDEHSSPTVYEPAVMCPPITAGFETGGDGPPITIDLNPTPPNQRWCLFRTGGDEGRWSSVARFQIQASYSSIALARMFACFASPSVIYGRLLVSCLTYEQLTWFDKCVESYTRLPFMVHGLHDVCISYVYHEHKL